jgi:phosphatidylserine/phosphatidylglycerophosphate/cardiolipin synthase-like enzyme
LEAHKRGVKVETILDKKTANPSTVTFLLISRMPTYIDHKSNNDKEMVVMVIDQATVITGPFDFTKAAEETNAENLLIIKSGELARLYVDNWNAHRQRLEPLAPRY